MATQIRPNHQRRRPIFDWVQRKPAPALPQKQGSGVNRGHGTPNHAGRPRIPNPDMGGAARPADRRSSGLRTCFGAPVQAHLPRRARHNPRRRPRQLRGLMTRLQPGAAQAGGAAQEINRSCPDCEAVDLRLLSCTGEPGKLVLKFQCRTCGEFFTRSRVRNDACEHGTLHRIPCDSCGRTWNDVAEHWR